MGIHLGMDSTTGAAGIEIVAASTTQNAYIDFTYPGVANRGKILYSNNLGCMTFTTTGTERMIIVNAGELWIGSTSSDGIYKLKVVGPCFFSAAVSGHTSIATSGALTCATVAATGLITCGSLSSGLPKNFDISSTYKPGWRIRHRCVETPEARVIYEFQVNCILGQNVVELPAYFETLANKHVICYVSPQRFGNGWAETLDGINLHVYANLAGTYNVTVVSTRMDKPATDEFDKYGDEYPEGLT